jgi:hypothetical protein
VLLSWRAIAPARALAGHHGQQPCTCTTHFIENYYKADGECTTVVVSRRHLKYVSPDSHSVTECTVNHWHVHGLIRNSQLGHGHWAIWSGTVQSDCKASLSAKLTVPPTS